ncbi:amidase [Microtetraspora fusca]|uniref:amidase n=1 Tax=Microtetraspora fusca TaxID=1997 RepID=UPI0008370805|nr:amidase [Microtetraspora fusca]
MRPSPDTTPRPRSAAETAERVRRGHVRAIDVVDAALAAVEADEHNAFVHVDPDGARRAAAEIDALVAAGKDPGPLAGVPFGVKDLEDCAGMPTRAGSLLFTHAPPADADSPLVRRLRRAGAIPIGKTATAEFGFDSATSTRAHGPTRNPWSPALTPGGSSGGSAAAVAAGLVPLATAGDGGGSIREPAAFCGLVGLKPTHGRVPRRTSHLFSTPGVLAASVADTALALEAAAGDSPGDRWSLPHRPGAFAVRLPPPGLRARFSADMGFAPVDPEVVEVAREGARRLAALAGFHLDERPLTLPDARPPWLVLACVELRRELGLLGPWPDVLDLLCPTTVQGALRGEQITAAEHAAALAACADLEAAMAAVLAETDLLITPSTACPPFAAEGPIPTVIDGRDAGVSGAEPFGPIANLTGVPAVSIPAGLTRDGLPVGMQVIAARFHDDLLLGLAAVAERAAFLPARARG